MAKTLLTPRFRHRFLASPAILVALALVAFCPSAFAQEPQAEIKLFVPDDKIDEVNKQVQDGFAQGTPEKKHRIFFFDTKTQDLYKNANGPVILRARRKETKTQSTVKFRRDERDPKLEKALGQISSKLEIETEFIVGKKGKPGISYSLDSKPGKELSELEGADGKKIETWFSEEQKQFLKAAGVTVDWKNLKVFGPIDADVRQWTESDKRVGTEMTAELWLLGTRKILELSCKKPGENLETQVAAFVAFFKGKNIPAAENPESKTKQALDHFATHPANSPEPAATTAAGQAPKLDKHRVAKGKLHNGDLVFIRSHSANAGPISDVTHSDFTHCGIVFNVNGTWKVREGAGRETEYSDIDAWQDRESTDYKTKKIEAYEPITVRRLIEMKNWSEKETAEKIGKLQKEAQKLHETKYDFGFAWGNHYTVQNGADRFSTKPNDKEYVYCSELIYKAFDRALTIKFGGLKTISDYNLTEEAKKILDYPEGMRRRGDAHYRLDEQVISPQDIFISDLLETIDVATQ